MAAQDLPEVCAENMKNRNKMKAAVGKKKSKRSDEREGQSTPNVTAQATAQTNQAEKYYKREESETPSPITSLF